MDWDAQAQNYWKDKPSAQAKKAQNNSKRNLIIAAVVAVLALCGAVSVWRGRSARKRALAAAEEEKKAKKKVVNLAPITLSSIKQAMLPLLSTQCNWARSMQRIRLYSINILVTTTQCNLTAFTRAKIQSKTNTDHSTMLSVQT